MRYRDKTERISIADRQKLIGSRNKVRPSIGPVPVIGSLSAAPKKRQNTRSPLKDLARKADESMCEVYPGEWDIRLTLPIRAVSEMNQYEHWTKTRKRKVVQQNTVKTAWIGFRVSKYLFKAPYHIRFTRIGCKKLDPDAVACCMKWIQDAVCAQLGIDDGSDQVAFEYAQEPTGRRKYAVRIEIRSAA